MRPARSSRNKRKSPQEDTVKEADAEEKPAIVTKKSAVKETDAEEQPATKKSAVKETDAKEKPATKKSRPIGRHVVNGGF